MTYNIKHRHPSKSRFEPLARCNNCCCDTRHRESVRRTLGKATSLSRNTRLVLLWIAATASACAGRTGLRPTSQTTDAADSLIRQVEVVRTTYGVPHISAANLAALGFGEAYVQSEDYGARVAISLLRARGQMGRWFGRDSVGEDFAGRLSHARAVEVYGQVDQGTRQIYEGFAAGVNRYIALHPEEFPEGFAPHFTGSDVLSKDVELPSPGQANRLLARLDTARRASPDDGSNAWAFAPSRTTSGRAILLRNPHLTWTAGYYEAHLVVPGVLDFYGDLRIGGPFAVIGGFNRDLGWATTNNDPILAQIYSLEADSARPDRYWLDGEWKQLQKQIVTAEYKDGAGYSTETRELFRTTIGPVIGRRGNTIYVVRAANDGEFRGGEQFLRMMRAHSLEDWKNAMRMRARVNSSFTYADRAGNIYYLWNASLPVLPHASGGDSVAIPIRRTSEAWSSYLPFDSLPQMLNPTGGYVHNENDAPYFTNMRAPLDFTKAPAYFPPPRLGLRSQLAIDLIDNDRKMSLEDVVKLKHSYRMLLADRVRDDLVVAVRSTNPQGDVARAIDLIAAWDRTVSPESRGGTLFETWWRRYLGRGATAADSAYSQPWSASAPTTTPRGLRSPSRAVEAFSWAVAEMTRRYGSFDVAWGDVHRVRRGSVDVPVGGCSSDLGCFRVLTYRDDPDGKRVATGSDGWILAVEFGDQPRAYSVLAYGESPRPDSPFFSDQAAMFARGELKRVAWTPGDIDAQTIRRYHPGEAR
ncbi:MAG TPA: penicillin acylase family protein [Gemmatimonadaceae bacterium]|nr:penicillin acylase family protein [Gemmatimonadaceae bacterium]